MKTISFRKLFLLLGSVSLLCVFSPFVIGLASAAFTYDGHCYGFTDGVWACPWWEYARNEMTWGFTMAFSPAMFLLAAWLTLGGYRLALRGHSGGATLPGWQAVLIPLLACGIGAALIYLVPFLLGARR